MYHETERRLSDAELAQLNKMLSVSKPVKLWSPLIRFTLWIVGIVIVTLAGAFLTSLFPLLEPMFRVIIGSLCFISFIYFVVVILLMVDNFGDARSHCRFLKDTRPKILEAIRFGTVKVKEVEAKAVVVKYPFEDEGIGYVFDIGGGSLLFLNGPEYVLWDVPRGWPNSKFSIVRTKSGDFLLEISCHGDELEPVLELYAEDCRDDLAWLTHEDLVEGDLLEFSRSLMVENGGEQPTG